ncbi:OmpP1/FadL family transporter [Paraliomyxa miuraensis]|uniref:OmpP1/FadL family transporter n=1 Tax=Paraliomyxa miuraensis TaxID=376150 RepID=UPI002258A8E9|nr:outer membrane protein transport protein [Paraliomyxa miuraensis]
MSGLAAALVPTIAAAGGFEIPDAGARALGRGGANVVGVSDPTAIHYNPGALAKLRGTHFLYNHSLIWHDTRFARAPLSDGWGADAGTTFEEVRSDRSLFPLGLFAALSTDFGLENWTFGAGVYGPHAVGRLEYPAYGPQSFMLTDMNVLMANYSLSAAWKLRDVFGVGITAQYVDLIALDYGLVIDSGFTSNLSPVPDENSTQLTSTLKLKDRTSGTAIVGLWYRPHRRVELGLASRVVPVFLKAEGTMEVDKPTLVTDDIRVTLPLTLPAYVRGGVRYIHETKGREWFDLELMAQWENWSVIDAYDVQVEGRISGQEVEDLHLAKHWKDTVSVRLGGDVHVIPKHLTLRAGGYWESGATPKNYSHLDFPSFMRGGVGAGLTAGGRGIYGTVGFLHVFQQSREVTELYGKVLQQRPIRPCPDDCDGLSGVPANAGRFSSRYEILNVGIELRFAELLGKRRSRGHRPGSDAPANPPTAPDVSTFDPAQGSEVEPGDDDIFE